MMVNLRYLRLINIFFLLVVAGITGTSSTLPPVIAQVDSTPTLSIPGLDGPVEIFRDDWGVPTIRATSDHDLFLGYGYAMSEDRLWQMDGSRRVAKGRVAEIAGYEQIHWDIYHQTLGLAQVAEESVDLLDPVTRDYLQAFADGVNLYIENVDYLPFEFLFMNYEPGPWEVSDTLAVSRLVAVWLAVDAWEEEMYGKLINTLGEETASELFRPVPAVEPDYTGAGGLPVLMEPPEPTGFNVPDAVFAPRESGRRRHKDFEEYKNELISGWLEPLARMSMGPMLEASNIWAVDGSMTESGEPILAMDPHLNYFTPSIMYEVSLDGGNFHCWGFTFPGMPFLPFGANENLSWGGSNFPADCQDLFIERLNPANPGQYDTDGVWVDFDSEIMSIPVRIEGGATEYREYPRYVSRHGPVIRQRTGEYLAMKWTGLQPSDDITSFSLAMQATTIEEFYEAFREFTCPPQNWCVAETGPEGRVGQIIAGNIPIRNGYDGTFPVDGSDSANDWIGFIPFDELPHRIDPPENFVVHANNLPLGGIDNGARPLGSTFATNHRVNRIIELLLAKSNLTPSDMVIIQMDDLDPSARIFVPGLLSAWDRLGSEYSDISDYMELLKEWDYHLTRDSYAATFFQLWMIELGESCFTDSLPFGFSFYLMYPDRWIPLLKEYIDGITTIEWLIGDDQETRDRKLLDAFQNAIERLRDDVGGDESEWVWGNLNLAVFAHGSGMETLIGAGSHPWGAGRYTVRVGHYQINSDLPFQNDFGAVFRSVHASVDGEWQIEAVLPPGEYGSTLAPHGIDQMDLWLAGELRPVSFGGSGDIGACTFRLVPE